MIRQPRMTHVIPSWPGTMIVRLCRCADDAPGEPLIMETEPVLGWYVELENKLVPAPVTFSGDGPDDSGSVAACYTMPNGQVMEPDGTMHESLDAWRATVE